ncbi:MAG: uridine kinase [Elusimicrobia bacterium]|nr:uridine kinase [Elusimicrobiota bacterium]MDE2236542.1 uridine kinase [Elusimicrobiota bacterium]MDE2425460.1 uridine kinase [Elusimicrobiota bacterium]
MADRPLLLGIAGGSGCGKSWLAGYLKRALGEGCVVICQDWYYRHKGGLPEERRRRLNFDHPDSIETPLLLAHLNDLLSGRAVEAPVYDYSSHSRLGPTRRLEPASLVILEGLLVLQSRRLRGLLDRSVFIDVPADLRLTRRIRRDVEQRRVDLHETLRLYEHCVRPMHERFVAPSARHATWVWRQHEDRRFPSELLRGLRRLLTTDRSGATTEAHAEANGSLA